MANIADYLNKIKSAVYGKDVRGAIHDAIKKVYDDASVDHDNANMEVQLARGTHHTLNDRLDKSDEELTKTNVQLSELENTKIIPILTNQKPIYPSKMVYIYQFNDNDNSIETVQILKSLNVNCVIIPRELEWQNDISELTSVIEFMYSYGIYSVIECDKVLESDSGYESELEFIKKIASLDGCYGVYSMDEPVIRRVEKSKQIQIYNLIKDVTDKPVIVSDVPCILGRESLFENYYTNESFDEYFINCYFTHDSTSLTHQYIEQAVSKLHNYGFPRNGVGANFPFWSEEKYNYPPTFSTNDNHVLGWRGLCNNNYGLFCWDHATYTNSLKKDVKLREIARRIPNGLFCDGDSKYLTNKFRASNGIVTTSIECDGLIITKDKNKKIIIKPKLNENDNDVLFQTATQDGKPLMTISNSGKIYTPKELETPRLNLTGGDVVTKIVRRTVAVSGMTVPSKSSVEKHVSCSDVNNAGAFVFGQPFSYPIPNGIAWNCYPRGANMMTIRYTNVTDNEIEIEPITWFINIVVTA